MINVTSFTISAYLNGVMFNDLAFVYATTGSATDTGTFNLPADFPADWFRAHGSSGWSIGNRQIDYYYNAGNLPASQNFDFPDISFEQPGFNSTTGAFSWTVNGTSAQDMYFIDLQLFPTTSSQEYRWRVYTSASNSSWTVPDLPVPYNTLIDKTQLDNDAAFTTQLDFSVYNFMSTINSLDDYWLRLIGGRTLDDILHGVNNETTNDRYYYGSIPG